MNPVPCLSETKPIRERWFFPAARDRCLSMTIFEPRQFGKYQLLDQLAVGGMAELYRAKLTGAQGFEKLIAIKKILPHLLQEENLVKAFIDEAKLAALLHHENIIQIYDFGSMDNEYFIAMEYLFGKDLRAIIRAAAKKELPLGLENILYVISHICAGLDYSHHLKDLQGKPLNIIHRDINPQNIFVIYEGQVKIIDFGIAKAASQNTTTRENLIKGKLAYMSPEQANGETIDHRSDIFSTGIILYELLAARRMFEGETLQVLSLVREARYDPPEEVIANLPTKLNDILHRSLAKDPAQRYHSCSEMLADLEECAFGLSLRPNARNFSRYMKALFESELAEEEISLWAKTQIYSAAEPEVENKPPLMEDDYEETLVLSKPSVSRKLWAKLRWPANPARGEKFAQLKKVFVSWKFNKVNYRRAAFILAVVIAVPVIFGIMKITFARTRGEASLPAASAIDGRQFEQSARLAAGKSALQAQRFALAISLFEEVLAGRPPMREQVLPLYAKALEAQAVALGETDQALAGRMLAKALEIDPDNIPALSQLGYIYVAQKQYPAAIATYQKVAGLNPRLPDAFFNLGYVYTITTDYRKAREMYLKVVELAPSFADEALFNLAVVQEKMGQRDQCVKSLEQAVALNPKNESARKYLRRLKRKNGDRG